jgi:Holliday junction resolvasome RuvABC ATP-dependent DNA helicase subunit
MAKRRVNITIDEDVHAQTIERLKMVGLDFSSIVEQTCLGFLGTTSELFRRFKEVESLEDVSPAEMRVLMLQAMGHLQVEIGSQSANVFKELDRIEAKQAQPRLTNTEPIHTVTTKRAKSKVL